MLNKHDFILILQQSVELAIWTKKDKEGKFYKYTDNKWKLVPLNERFQITKIEGQVWISLYELLLNPVCVSKYEYTEYKKNQILKLRSHLNEVVIDQIPNLAALQRFLENLAISEPPAYKSDLIIEQVSEIYDNIVSKYKGKWKELARTQAKTVLDPNEKDVKENAKRFLKKNFFVIFFISLNFQVFFLRWAETYNNQVLENLIDEPAKCAECGEPAQKRCSRCQSEWYCRR